MSLGGAGSTLIPQAVAEVLVNNLVFNDTLSDAIEKPRVYYDVTTGETKIEGKMVQFPFRFAQFP